LNNLASLDESPVEKSSGLFYWLLKTILRFALLPRLRIRWPGLFYGPYMSDELREIKKMLGDLTSMHSDHRDEWSSFTEAHSKHHEYIEEEIERKKAQKEFWMAIKQKVVTAGVIGAVVFAGHAIWQALVDKVHGG
jgi:hypothetical protein